MPAVIVSRNDSIGAVALDDTTLDVSVIGVVLQVSVAFDGSTVSTRGFLLGGSTSSGRLRFHLRF